MLQRVCLFLLSIYSIVAYTEPTVLKFYRPFGEVVEQIVPEATTTVSGQCLSQSQIIVREDAWRCQAEGRIYDPCFVKAAGKQNEALCPQSPWSSEGVRLLLATALNSENHISLDMASAYPWGIELVNGEHCQAVEAEASYQGMPIRYRCSENKVLLGHLQRCKAVWSMLEKTPSGIETVPLAKAWF